MPTARIAAGGVDTPYRSVPAAIFLLAYAAADSLVTQASKQQGVLGGADGKTPLGLGSKGLVEAWAHHRPLMARARITPTGATGIHPWRLLESDDLNQYLTDACLLRNRLAHSGATQGAKLRSPYFVKLGKAQLDSMTLMLAEGLLQSVQDIAYLTLDEAARQDWEWVLPTQSGTWMMSRRLWRHEGFPLPE
ncbi:hypothetical protein [Nocardia sp. NPDC050175]|uniref:hypothetical protein n=1 Tax=Nocardia sp. NPDC050175 TaxID=3364317 RepID=UPI0037ACD52D